jgi:hypothetical protein
VSHDYALLDGDQKQTLSKNSSRTFALLREILLGQQDKTVRRKFMKKLRLARIPLLLALVVVQFSIAMPTV